MGIENSTFKRKASFFDGIFATNRRHGTLNSFIVEFSAVNYFRVSLEFTVLKNFVHADYLSIKAIEIKRLSENHALFVRIGVIAWWHNTPNTNKVKYPAGMYTRKSLEHNGIK